MQKDISFKIIDKTITQQKNTLFFNYMPHSLDRVDKYLKKITEKNKLWKIRNNVQAIEAFQCQLKNIEMVGTFYQLSDLNIG